MTWREQMRGLATILGPAGFTDAAAECELKARLGTPAECRLALLEAMARLSTSASACAEAGDAVGASRFETMAWRAREIGQAIDGTPLTTTEGV